MRANKSVLRKMRTERMLGGMLYSVRRFLLPSSAWLFACLSFTAHAQVFQCNDASGRTIFSDAPCASGQMGYQILQPPTPAEIERDMLRAREAQERNELARRERREREALATAQAREDALLRQRSAPYNVQARPDAHPSSHRGWQVDTPYDTQGHWGSPYPPQPSIDPEAGCAMAQRDLEVIQGNRNVLPSAKHQQLQSAQARLHRACRTAGRPPSRSNYRTPPHPIPPPHLQRALPFTHCTANGCYDSSGTIVHHGRHGTTVIDPSASGTCVQIGNNMQCY